MKWYTKNILINNKIIISTVVYLALNLDLVCIHWYTLSNAQWAWYIPKRKALGPTTKRKYIDWWYGSLGKSKDLIKLSRDAMTHMAREEKSRDATSWYLEGFHLWQAAVIHCRPALSASNVSSAVVAAAVCIYICMCGSVALPRVALPCVALPPVATPRVAI